MEYFIETYGCQMNKAETAAIENDLLQIGWCAAEDYTKADLIILNTCSVRNTAEDRIWGRIGFYKNLKKKQDFKLAVIGCMSERLKEEFFEQTDGIDIILGNFQKHRFLDAIEESFSNTHKVIVAQTGTYQFYPLYTCKATARPLKAFLPIMHGCNNFCSYCIVPYVRGPEVSRPVKSILTELEQLAAQSCREVTLLGQNVNSYSCQEAQEIINFPKLLECIIKHTKQIPWLRFLTSHPKDISDELIELIAGHETLCKHIHLPIQHGSNKILDIMGRGYTKENYLGLVEKIRNRIDGVSLTTDLLIGFPGETDSDFNDTLALMEKIQFTDAFTYKYNPRKGTKAYSWGDSVPEEVKLERLSALIELQRSISHKQKQKRIGRHYKVLVEGQSKKKQSELLARTENDEMVVFPGNIGKIGEFVQVQIISLVGNTLYGKEVLA